MDCVIQMSIMATLVLQYPNTCISEDFPTLVCIRLSDLWKPLNLFADTNLELWKSNRADVIDFALLVSPHTICVV